MCSGRSSGTLTPCVVYQGLDGVPMLWVQPLDKEAIPKASRSWPAIPHARPVAGVHLLEGGREAAMALDPWFCRGPYHHRHCG